MAENASDILYDYQIKQKKATSIKMQPYILNILFLSLSVHFLSVLGIQDFISSSN